MKKQYLTEKQERVFNIIVQHFDEHGHSPTIAEIARMLNVKSSRTVTQYLDALESKGVIYRDKYGRRGIVPLRRKSYTDSNTVQIQVMGFAGCDNQNILANPLYDEYISVSRKLITGDEHNFMAIRAVGNSMTRAGISDGDTVLIERTEHPNNNERVLAVVDDTAVIKRLKRAENSVILNPDSYEEGYSPIVMQKDFKVFGRVVDIIKKPEKNELQFIPMNE